MSHIVKLQRAHVPLTPYIVYVEANLNARTYIGILVQLPLAV